MVDVWIALFSLCWGSFLNVVGYRIIHNKGLLGRSFCPQCTRTIAWYDLIPVFSWLFLWGSCRFCKKPISILYPFIELLTAGIALLSYHMVDPHYWLGYALFYSALIVIIRTDFETMLISRYTTWCMIPCALLLSLLGALPITPLESLLGACFGYGLLWVIARLFYALRSIEGMGEGDLDLLAMIGSFSGITGAWMSLFLGSLGGSIAGIIVLCVTKDRFRAIAFGPWLSFGALTYTLAQSFFLKLLFT